MRNVFFKIVLFSGVLFSLSNMQAQTQLDASTVSAQQNVATGTNADSFGDIAMIGQQIALAQRKIQAMELKNNLDALEAQQLKGNFPYKVLRIEGFNKILYAILSDDAGVLYQAGPGDIIGNQYRITLLRPSSVNVMDINTHRSYAVPFVRGDTTASSAADDSVSVINNTAPPTSASPPVEATT